MKLLIFIVTISIFVLATTSQTELSEQLIPSELTFLQGQRISRQLQETTPVQPFWRFVSLIGSNATSMIHQLRFPLGIKDSISDSKLLSSLAVQYKIFDSQTKATTTTEGLTINSIELSSSRDFLVINSSFPVKLTATNLNNSKILITFAASSLISTFDQAYTQVTHQFLLTEPQFNSSFYFMFEVSLVTQLPGIALTLVAVIMLFFSASTKKSFHQCFELVMLIQIIGLLRMKGYPLAAGVYEVLHGYSYTELHFIPNLFFDLFPQGYKEDSANSVAFCFGDHNFVRNIGSPLLIFLIIQACGFAGFAIHAIIFKTKNSLQKINWERFSVIPFKRFQELVFFFFWPKLMFSIVISIASLSLDLSYVSFSVSSVVSFAISQAFAFIVLIVAIIFLVLSFKKTQNLRLQLYKITNIIRGVFIWVCMLNIYAGIILMLIGEIIFLIIELIFFRQHKINWILFTIDRILTITALGVAGMLQNGAILFIVLTIIMAVLCAIKGIYLIVGLHRFFIQDQLQSERKMMLDQSISESKLKDESAIIEPSYQQNPNQKFFVKTSTKRDNKFTPRKSQQDQSQNQLKDKVQESRKDNTNIHSSFALYKIANKEDENIQQEELSQKYDQNKYSTINMISNLEGTIEKTIQQEQEQLQEIRQTSQLEKSEKSQESDSDKDVDFLPIIAGSFLKNRQESSKDNAKELIFQQDDIEQEQLKIETRNPFFNKTSYEGQFRQPKQKIQDNEDNEISIDSEENQNTRKLESMQGSRRRKVKQEKGEKHLKILEIQQKHQENYEMQNLQNIRVDRKKKKTQISQLSDD